MGYHGIDGQSVFLFVPVHVGALDDPEIQVRPVDEPGLADTDTTGAGEHAGDRRVGLTETEPLAFLNKEYL